MFIRNTQKSYHFLIVFGLIFGCYYFINAVLAGPLNQFIGGPWSPDDYHALMTPFISFHNNPARPISTDVIALFSRLGSRGAYLLMHFVTVLYMALVIYFVEILFEIRFTIFSICVFGLLASVVPSITMLGHYLGLLTNLSSCLFGLLTMVLLFKGFQQNRIDYYFLSLLSYMLCLFSKEDYILPMVLVALYLLALSIMLQPNYKKRPAIVLVVCGMLLGLVLFYFYNFKVAVNPFITGANNSSYYHIGLSVNSIFETTKAYFWNNRYIKVFTVLFALAVVYNLRFYKGINKIKVSLLLLTAISCAAPYLVLPNHVNDYYLINWLPWIAVMVVIAFHHFTNTAYVTLNKVSRSNRYRVHYLSVALVVVVVAGMIKITQQERVSRSAWIGQITAVNSNILATLEKHKDLLNQQPYIAIVGIGDFSPWANNYGDHSEYNHISFIREKLKIQSKWVIFLNQKQVRHSLVYDVNKNDQFIQSKNVNTLSLSKICNVPKMLYLTFDAKGKGFLLDDCKKVVVNM